MVRGSRIRHAPCLQAPPAGSPVLLRGPANRLDLESVQVEDKGAVERHRVLRPQPRLPRVESPAAERRFVEGVDARAIRSLEAHVKTEPGPRTSLALSRENPEHG